MRIVANIVLLIAVSCLITELLGYWLHRLLHSGAIGFLSRNHMKHHLVLYGPLQNQRSSAYRDATTESASLGNIGLEWLMPAGLLLFGTVTAFHFLHVRLIYRFVSLGTSLLWGFLMFSYLHDVMHIEGFWMEKNRWLGRWFTSARTLHDIHHEVVNREGLMDKNFGIGFFLFDRLFGTLCLAAQALDKIGYDRALERFRAILEQPDVTAATTAPPEIKAT